MLLFRLVLKPLELYLQRKDKTGCLVYYYMFIYFISNLWALSFFAYVYTLQGCFDFMWFFFVLLVQISSFYFLYLSVIKIGLLIVSIRLISALSGSVLVFAIIGSYKIIYNYFKQKEDSCVGSEIQLLDFVYDPGIVVLTIVYLLLLVLGSYYCFYLVKNWLWFLDVKYLGICQALVIIFFTIVFSINFTSIFPRVVIALYVLGESNVDYFFLIIFFIFILLFSRGGYILTALFLVCLDLLNVFCPISTIFGIILDIFLECFIFSNLHLVDTSLIDFAESESILKHQKMLYMKKIGEGYRAKAEALADALSDKLSIKGSDNTLIGTLPTFLSDLSEFKGKYDNLVSKQSQHMLKHVPRPDRSLVTPYIKTFKPFNILPCLNDSFLTLNLNDNTKCIESVELKGAVYDKTKTIRELKDLCESNLNVVESNVAPEVLNNAAKTNTFLALYSSHILERSRFESLKAALFMPVLGGVLKHVTPADMKAATAADLITLKNVDDYLELFSVHSTINAIGDLNSTKLNKNILLAVLSDYFPYSYVTEKTGGVQRFVNFNVKPLLAFNTFTTQFRNLVGNVNHTFNEVSTPLFQKEGQESRIVGCYSTRHLVFTKNSLELYTNGEKMPGDLLVYVEKGNGMELCIIEYKFISLMFILEQVLAHPTFEFNSGNHILDFLFPSVFSQLKEVYVSMICSGFDFKYGRFLYQCALELSKVEFAVGKVYDIESIDALLRAELIDRLLNSSDLPEVIKDLIREGKIVFKFIKL